MRSEPRLLLALLPALAFGALGGRPASAAPPPLVLLFSRSSTDASDERALVKLRTRLRADQRLAVLTFDSEAPSVVRAAAETHHPEWLTSPITSDVARLDIARAVGANFAAVVADAGRGKLDVHLLETTPAARVRDYTASPTDRAADAIERDALTPAPAVASPVRPVPPPLLAMPVAPPVVAPPVVAPPVVAPPVVAPPVVAPPVVAPPVVAPPVVAPPVVAPPVVAPPVVAPPVVAPPVVAPPVVAPPVVAPPVVAPPVVAPPVVAPPVVVPPTSSPTPKPAPVPASAIPVIPSGLDKTGGGTRPVTLSPPATGGAALPSPDPSRVAQNAADLAAVQPLIAKGDRAAAAGAMVEAYSYYRSAINAAPLSDVPRLKLAQAYLLGGLPDKALDEAQRALQVAPNSVAIQEFLIRYDAENGTTIGATARYKALVAKNPLDPTAHLDLGDALWNGGAFADAEAEYKTARDLAPGDSLGRRIALAHLARLYAAMGRNDACLTAMRASGGLAYPLVLGVVQSDADTLTASIDTSHADFDAGKVTRADFYAKIKEDGAQAQALADFVAKITPPNAYSRSHLDRVQAATLLAQSAAILQNFIETSDPARRDKATQLEKDAQAEMLTAHAAEQKLGLWGGDAQVGEGQ